MVSHGKKIILKILSFEPGALGQWDDTWILMPSILLLDNAYYMWYTGTTDIWGAFKVGLATSVNGIDWTKSSSNPVLVASSTGWDDYQLACDSVLFKDDSLSMWLPAVITALYGE